MVIDKTTLYKSAWTAIRDHLNTNLASSFYPGYKKAFIFSTRQDDSAANTSPYPYIVVNPVKDKREEIANDHTVTDHDMNTVIEVLCKDSESADIKGDLVQALFETETHRNTLNAAGVINVNIQDSHQEEEIVEGEDIYVRYLVITWQSPL